MQYRVLRAFKGRNKNHRVEWANDRKWISKCIQSFIVCILGIAIETNTTQICERFECTIFYSRAHKHCKIYTNRTQWDLFDLNWNKWQWQRFSAIFADNVGIYVPILSISILCLNTQQIIACLLNLTQSFATLNPSLILLVPNTCSIEIELS